MRSVGYQETCFGDDQWRSSVGFLLLGKQIIAVAYASSMLIDRFWRFVAVRIILWEKACVLSVAVY
jgi:hypothetical protein